MTEPLEPSPAPADADSGSFLGNLFNLYFEPRATFEKIFVKPQTWLAILLQTVIAVTFTTIWLQKADLHEFMRAQMEQNPSIQQMPSEQVDRMIETQANVMKTWGRIAPLLAPLVLDLLFAALLMFMFRFFMAADVSFMQSLTTVAWTFVALGLVQTPIMLAVFALKADWNVDPNEVVQANLTILFEVGSLPRWLWSLLSSLDLFTFWTIFLLATGYSVSGKKSLGSGIWGVAIPWGLYVMAKVGLMFLFA